MAEQQAHESMTSMQALHALRILWGGMLASPLIIGGVLIAMMDPDASPVEPSLRRMLVIVGLTLPVAIVFVGLFARNQIYKAHWRGNVITPGGYLSGNLVLFGAFEAVYVLAFVLIFVIGFHVGLAAIAVAAILIHVANFPTGKPMRPHASELAPRETL